MPRASLEHEDMRHVEGVFTLLVREVAVGRENQRGSALVASSKHFMWVDNEKDTSALVSRRKEEWDSWQEFVRKERSPGVMITIGHEEPVFQEGTWDAEEETRTGVIISFPRKTALCPHKKTGL